MSIKARVTQLMVEQLGVEPEDVTLDARLGEQLGADSLDALQLTIALEDEYDIEIPDAEAEQLLRVGDVIAYIQTRVGTANG